MGRIRVLEESVRNLIAAGEVVERPASVVKELVENAIDAEASDICVEITGGGLTKIVVTDDGCGMDAEDLGLSVVRHATSKLSSPEDLTQIRTMGFRGEALPSIAEISKMAMTSKPVGSPVGHFMRLHAGRVVEIGEKGCPNGTRVEVSDLFHNIPARKKFMKTERTELGHIKDLVEKCALVHPDRRFRLVSEGKEILGALASDPHGRLLEIFGPETAASLYPLEASSGDVALRGWIGDPSLGRDGGGGIYWFVNGRPVRDRILNHAAAEAYRSLLPRGLSPFSVLHLHVSPGQVDVNVHPTKNEVRFLKGNAVHDFVVHAVRMKLSAIEREAISVRPVAFAPESFEISSSPFTPLPHRQAGLPQGERGLLSRTYASAQGRLLSEGKFSSLRVIGQLHESYLLCEREDGALIVIDQHAAHERIGYEKLKRGHEGRQTQSQRLLIPEMVVIPSKNVGYLQEALPDLAGLGWEVEFFGGESFCVQATPSIFRRLHIKEALARMAHDLAESGTVSSHTDRIDLLMKVTACHGQVRAGERMEEAEIRYLLKEMDEMDWSDRCPHGRPAIYEITLSEIEKWFARR